MNQAIQFPDREEWDPSMQAVCFPALVNGMQMICGIKGDALKQRFGVETPEQFLATFRDYRWDLEEEAEQLIRQQKEDDQGIVWLS
ncbi:hypothetical protein Y71_02225 [Kosakonia radicincitans DSM 16656]|uniref:DUF1488 domain-containing protein n=1 Tax=Kosakonia radicincitans TaxID=283686 RepID=UPI000272D71B|nr:DUF1488 domain-containing protein [Kosakonia radicincitans]APG20185.1 hypothetical protein A3780_22460 [Kosakonia radicincitans]ARD58791.1 hypothetical protein Y71_02225 [Kosakonia radicincitans DSM 16656]QEM89539.1 DUF1488 domain-containing protein [Kosakonia radicincitans]